MKEKVNLEDEEPITILKDKGYNLKIEVDTTKRSVADALKLRKEGLQGRAFPLRRALWHDP